MTTTRGRSGLQILRTLKYVNSVRRWDNFPITKSVSVPHVLWYWQPVARGVFTFTHQWRWSVENNELLSRNATVSIYTDICLCTKWKWFISSPKLQRNEHPNMSCSLVCQPLLKLELPPWPLEVMLHHKRVGSPTLCESGLVLRLPLSSGWRGGIGGTGWVKRSRLCLLYCRAQSHTGGRGGSDGSEDESGWSTSLQPLTGV